MYSTTGFVQSIDGFVRQRTIADVSFGQRDTSLNRLRSVGHIVVIFISLLDVIEDLQSIFRRGRLKLYFLETAIQCTVFLDALPKFVDGRGADALHFATRQSRFQNIGGIQTTGCTSRTDDGVDFINEEHHFTMRLQFVNEFAQSVFKLATVLCSGHDRSHVQRNQSLTG